MPCAVITGSTKGIGLAIAKELAAVGYAPILNYSQDVTRAERALSCLQEIRKEARLVRADVTTESGVLALFEAALDQGAVEVWVNNIGQFHDKPFLETPIGDWETILRSNLLSAVLCCQRVLPFMRERRRGSIINIASFHADQLRARPNTLPYAIAKAGLIHLTQTLAKTEGAYGIRVNALGPGFIDGGDHTSPEHAKNVSLERLGNADDVAKAVRFLISEDARYITGAFLNVDGGALL